MVPIDQTVVSDVGAWPTAGQHNFALPVSALMATIQD